MNCLYIYTYILLLYSILYIIAIRSSDSLDIKMIKDIKNFDFLLCRVIYSGLFNIYNILCYCICMIIYNTFEIKHNNHEHSLDNVNYFLSLIFYNIYLQTSVKYI